MTYRTRTVRRLLLAGVVAGCTAGGRGPDPVRPSFDHRAVPASMATRQPATGLLDSGVRPASADLPLMDPVPGSPAPGELAPPVTDGRCAPGPLSLPDAIALAYRLQPRL